MDDNKKIKNNTFQCEFKTENFPYYSIFIFCKQTSNTKTVIIYLNIFKKNLPLRGLTDQTTLLVEMSIEYHSLDYNRAHYHYGS